MQLGLRFVLLLDRLQLLLARLRHPILLLLFLACALKFHQQRPKRLRLRPLLQRLR